MGKQLYRGRIFPLYEGHREESKAFWDYTHATSSAQASLFLQRRYPYPGHFVETPVLDPRGNVVVRTNPRFDATVTHLGYESITISDPDGLKTDVDLIVESQERLSHVAAIPDSSLTERQLCSLTLVRGMADDISPKRVRGIYGANIPPASDRVATAGMYARERQEIFISCIQLERGKTAVDTAIHEVAHHTSGAEDGEQSHNVELSRLGGVVVSRVAEGHYDRLLRDPNFTW